MPPPGLCPQLPQRKAHWGIVHIQPGGKAMFGFRRATVEGGEHRGLGCGRPVPLITGHTQLGCSGAHPQTPRPHFGPEPQSSACLRAQ